MSRGQDLLKRTARVSARRSSRRKMRSLRSWKRSAATSDARPNGSACRRRGSTAWPRRSAFQSGRRAERFEEAHPSDVAPRLGSSKDTSAVAIKFNVVNCAVGFKTEFQVKKVTPNSEITFFLAELQIFFDFSSIQFQFGMIRMELPLKSMPLINANKIDQRVSRTVHDYFRFPLLSSCGTRYSSTNRLMRL